MIKLFLTFSFVVVYSILIYAYHYSVEQSYYFSVIRMDYNSGKVITGGLIVFCISALISPKEVNPRSFSYFLFVLMIYTPTIAISALSKDTHIVMYLALVSALIIGIKTGVPDFSIKIPRFKIPLFKVLLIINFFLVFMILIKYRAILDFPSFSDVYILRFKARELTNYTFGLILSWSKFVFAPLGFLLGVYYKKMWLVISSLGLYLSIYMSTGAKSAVIYPFLLYFVCYLFQRVSTVRIKCFMLSGVIFLLGFFMFIEVYLGYVIYPYTVERAFIAPGVLSNLYYNFFSASDKALLGYSILSGFIDYSYDLEPSFLIGREHFTADTRANASFFADGYANFGVIGIVIFSFFVRFLIFLYSMVSFNWSKAVSNTFFIPYALYLISASPLTMLITGGFFVVLLLGLFFEVD